MKRHVAGQHRRKPALECNQPCDLHGLEQRLVLKFGGMLAAAVILLVALKHLPAPSVVIEEPFYLFIGIIAAFVMGLVVFFTTREG